MNSSVIFNHIDTSTQMARGDINLNVLTVASVDKRFVLAKYSMLNVCARDRKIKDRFCFAFTFFTVKFILL